MVFAEALEEYLIGGLHYLRPVMFSGFGNILSWMCICCGQRYPREG